MSRYIRPRLPGATVFLTVALAARGTDLLIRHVDVLRDVARRTARDKPFHVRAWVVLPDHMHCVWTLPEGDADYSNRMGMLKARFTRALTGGIWEPRRVGFHPTHNENGGVEPHPTDLSPSKITKQDGRVWQRRFWEHHIRDEDDLRAAVRYCWINPVKHGFVDHPGDWPYSSWHRDGGGDAGT